MHHWILLKGFAAGLAIAAPLGPVGVLCIRRTAGRGIRAGLVSGLGAALADALFAAVAGYGLNAIASAILAHEGVMRVVSGILLVVLGIRALFDHMPNPSEPATSGRFVLYFSSGFLLTIANVMTLFALIAIIAGLGLKESVGHLAGATVFVAGAFGGSLLWWVLLCYLTRRFHPSPGHPWIRWINPICGIVVLAFGVISICQGIR